jgi:hypothetical protein
MSKPWLSDNDPSKPIFKVCVAGLAEVADEGGGELLVVVDCVGGTVEVLVLGGCVGVEEQAAINTIIRTSISDITDVPI